MPTRTSKTKKTVKAKSPKTKRKTTTTKSSLTNKSTTSKSYTKGYGGGTKRTNSYLSSKDWENEKGLYSARPKSEKLNNPKVKMNRWDDVENKSRRSSGTVARKATDRQESTSKVKQSVTKSKTSRKGKTKSKTHSTSTTKGYTTASKSKTSRAGKTKTKAISVKKASKKLNRAYKKKK
jgi:hypothetical protein